VSFVEVVLKEGSFNLGSFFIDPTFMDAPDPACPCGFGMDWYALSVAWSAVVVA